MVESMDLSEGDGEWDGQYFDVQNQSSITLPATYTFTLDMGLAGSSYVDGELTCFMEDLATNLLPSGNMSDHTPTFTWTPVPQSNVFYLVEVIGDPYWRSDTLKDISSMVYGGSTLKNGQDYTWLVMAKPADPENLSRGGNCYSWASQTFTHVAR